MTASDLSFTKPNVQLLVAG